MLKHKGTYEIISLEDIGLERPNEAGIVLGKLRYVMAPSFFFCFFYVDAQNPLPEPGKDDGD